MIEDFKDNWLKSFFVDDKYSKKIPSTIKERLFRKLQIIDDATIYLDLRSPPSNHFEKLSGNLQGKVSIRINNQWRLIFVWSDLNGKASHLYLDNHDYK